MIIWKFTNDSDGQRFAFPYPPGQSEIRKIHYQNSRQALYECLLLKGIINPSEDDLKVSHHHTLEKHNNTLVSIAHTRGGACAVIGEKSSTLLGVGIDCESLERNIRHEILDKFSDEADQAKTNLHLWCSKEAAFKASSYFWRQEKTFILKDIRINHNRFEIPDLLWGELEHHEESGFLITKAFVRQLF